jgi:hypothetical protein
LKRFTLIVLLDIILCPQSHSKLVLTFPPLKNAHLHGVPFPRFSFLPLSKSLPVSLNAALFAQSHSRLILASRVFHHVHFRTAHHCVQFLFLPRFNDLAAFVSMTARPFGLSHSHLTPNL